MINAIGIPLLYPNDVLLERNDVLLKAAYLYQVPAYIYALPDVGEYIKSGKIRALYWNGGAYKECYTDLPRFTEIYCSFSSLKQRYPKELEWLMNNTTLTDAIGLSKYDLQRGLLFSDLTQYAIPTFLIHSYEELLSSAAMFPISFLKPLGGRKAKGAMKLEKKNGTFYYSTPEGSGELTHEFFLQYYSSAGFDENALLLLEPCLNILDDEGHAVDFRCQVSLNGEGKWQNVLTYARIGGSGVASNISRGGSTNFAESVLEMMIPGHGAEKLAEINRVALQVAEFVQKESPNPVSWLGIDICVDRPSNQVYVIEANSKPGMKIVSPWPLSLVRAQYFKYLLSLEDQQSM